MIATRTMTSHVELGQGAREEAVTVESHGRTLHGNAILVNDESRHGVLFIHGYGGVRSGPHNLLTYMARELGRVSIPSIRFDLTGRGESDGVPPESSLAHMAEDALSAAAYLKSAANLNTVTIVGICSGGNVGIGILDRLPECNGLYLISVYPFGDADSFARDAKRSVAILKEYWRKLWLPTTWRKLGRGDVQVKVIAGVLLKPLRRFSARSKAKPKEPSSSGHPLDNLTSRSLRVRMVYGSADPEYALSMEYYQRFSDEKHVPLDVVTVPGANHNFYSMEWKQRLSNELKTFIKES